jgi:hypothetical protein
MKKASLPGGTSGTKEGEVGLWLGYILGLFA